MQRVRFSKVPVQFSVPKETDSFIIKSAKLLKPSGGNKLRTLHPFLQLLSLARVLHKKKIAKKRSLLISGAISCAFKIVLIKTV